MLVAQRQQTQPPAVGRVAELIRQSFNGLRGYQQDGVQKIKSEWAAGHKNVLYVLPTGGGKTRTLAHIVLDEQSPACVMAHRRELISQLSLALARCGVVHRIVAPDNVVRHIMHLQMSDPEIGANFVDPGARVGVASVDTVDARMKKGAEADKRWFKRVLLWVMDEAHHLLQKNKWGRALLHFTNADVRGLGVTATPERADGKGLGAHASGVFHVMVEGPTMRWLINQGYLCDYRIVCPPNDLDMSDARLGKDGDYTQKSNSNAVKNSSIMGDAVKHYLKFVPGRRAVTFVPDVEIATEQSLKFNNAGIKSEALSAKSEESLRINAVARLAKGELQQIVNVDLFGEGFDLPAIDAVCDCAPTQSFSRYAQRFGRMLRPVYAIGYDLGTREGRLAAIANGPKPHGWYIDHVGNVLTHGGPPDKVRVWSLSDRVKRSAGEPSDEVPIIRCLNPACQFPYEKFEPCCPFCGEPKPKPQRRDGPEFVDGDLSELSPEVLARMRGEEIDTERSVSALKDEIIESKVPAVGQQNALKAELADQIAQADLRSTMQWWAGWQRDNGLDTLSKREMKFYYTFGIDVLSARALKANDARELREKILKHMGVEE